MDIVKLYNNFLKSNGVSIDTRTIKKNNLFFGIKGNNFDGNKFALESLEKGASFAVVDDIGLSKHNNVFYVKNSLETLQKLANHHRNKINIPIIAITGTNGKTTTKELIASILSEKYNVGYTKGNYNNDIGVPLTILSFNKNLDYGIIEMGANHKGEIKDLCAIAEPNYGIITNIGKAHLEGFGSTKGVINAKRELYDYLKLNNGKVFLDSDNTLLKNICDVYTVITYSISGNADFTGNIVEINPYIKFKWDKKSNINNERIIQSKLIGKYNFENLLASTTIGSYFGVEDSKIKNAIENYVPTNNRSQIINTKQNIILLDAYNANPSSMKLAIENFHELKSDKEKILIIGDMFELGEVSKDEHLTTLYEIKKLDFKKVFLVGEIFNKFSKQFKYTFFKNTIELIEYIKKEKLFNSFILVKGSRGIKLEIITDYL